MTPAQFELFYILKKQDKPFGERFGAAIEIGNEALYMRIESVDIPVFYPVAVDLWRSLGLSKTDREDARLFHIRNRLANVCWRLSIRSADGHKFFKYFPRVQCAEGFEIRKDLIYVITDEDEKILMMDWWKQNDIIVYCNRCGLDITYEVSIDCPFSKSKYP